jgi:C-terminal processing protease CtpA/Prc
LLPCAHAQDAVPTPAALGLRLTPIPDLLYEHLPRLKRGEGVVVEHVQPGSPAARAGLRRHDVLLSCDGRPLRGADDVGRLGTGRPVALVLLRGGKETTLEVTLTVPPARPGDVVKGAIKPGGPPAVTVEAQRLEGGRLQITFSYYSHGTGKLERVTCSGSLGDIENEVRELGKQNKMPSRVQDLVDVALRRIRVLNFPQEE